MEQKDMFGKKKEEEDPNLVLGQKYRDKITGFEGIAIARSQWLYQCERIALQSQQLKDGLVQDAQWFDALQLEEVEEPPVEEEKKRVTGGPRPAPQRHPDPTR